MTQLQTLGEVAGTLLVAEVKQQCKTSLAYFHNSNELWFGFQMYLYFTTDLQRKPNRRFSQNGTETDPNLKNTFSTSLTRTHQVTAR